MTAPHKPSQAEEEYFAREEAEKKRKLALTQVKQLAAAEREQLKQLHFMHCPKCGMKMQEIALAGVIVERCFHCHGIFLDEKDVEKLSGLQGYWARMLRFFARRDYSSETDAG